MNNKTTQPRVIILGIDGLEYSLVEKWKLTNIMQKTYCKTDLSDYRVIVTPPIWGSMITGEIDEEIVDIWVKQFEITGGGINTKQKWWAKFGYILPPILNLWIWYHIIAPLVGGDLFEKTANYVIDKKVENIFQYFKKPWTNGIPSYGKSVSDISSRYYLHMAFLGKAAPFKDYITKHYKTDKEKLFNVLDKNENDFLFWYTMILDKISHVYISKPVVMMKYYFEINELVGKVIERFPKSNIYIISDHGMRPLKNRWGRHSDYGFFSSNTGETIDKPYDLFDLIKKYKTK